MEEDSPLAGNWDAKESEEGLPDAVDSQLGGEVDVDDVAFVAVDFSDDEEEEMPAPPLLRLMGLYRSQKKPSAKTLSDHFEGVWRLRTGVEFKPMGKNYFTITFGSEGDYIFVARGGPWIFNGDALLVKPFDDEARPSESTLDAVPVWARVFDVPYKKQTKAYGQALGNTPGEVLVVDVLEGGHGTREFLRVRVLLPYNRRLQKEVTLEYMAKGVTKRITFKIRYERVPHFCFHCGFMGHDKDVCEKKIRGLVSKGYDSTLRCSPFKKFEFRAAYTPSPGQSRARRDLNFNLGSAGVADSGTRSAASHASSHNTPVQAHDMIPPRVDANDGFDEKESATAEEEAMHLQRKSRASK